MASPPSTDDFAAELKKARLAAGFSQADLGGRAGLTGSYVCMLELRRKPAPSPDVVSALARALSADETRLQERAALERTPEPVRQRVVRLVRERLRSRRSRDRLLTTSMFHLASKPGFAPDVFADSLGLPEGMRPIFQRIAERVRHVPSAEEAATKSRDLLREVVGREREALARALPRIVSAAASGGPAAVAGSVAALRQPAVADPSTVSPASDEPRPWRRVPVLLAPPPPGLAVLSSEAADVFHVDRRLYRPGTYVLVADNDDAWPRVEKGDWCLVDSRAVPADGDLVVVRDATTPSKCRLRWLKRAGTEARLDAARADVPPLRMPESRLSLAGVVRWVFRPLAGPPPPRRRSLDDMPDDSSGA